MKTSIEDIIKTVTIYHPKADTAKIREAFDFTKKVHGTQRRETGEPFLAHPIAAALSVAQMGLDEKTVMAAILHDVVEDTKTPLSEVRKRFGNEVGDLVDGVTKLLKLPSYERRLQEYEIENIRKLFLYTASDVRVVLIKLADRLHNMQTLFAKSPEKRRRISLETLNIYAPIANRLGMGEIRGKLEDLAFPYVYPEAYKWIKGHVGEQYRKRQRYTGKRIKEIKKLLSQRKARIIDVHGRAKHWYSLYRKLLLKGMDVSNIYDLVAIRIIVPKLSDCYSVLGILHDKWPPLPTRIKDYIASPKINGYQSLHTTVMFENNRPGEIQIRTLKMHEEAEFGVAAHWHYEAYKESRKMSENERRIAKLSNIFRQFRKNKKNRFTKWLKQVNEIQDEARPSREFINQVKSDVLKNRIVIFGKEGKTIDLPEKSTALDFAYSLGTKYGNHCVGTRINGTFQSMFHTLKNADSVQIITDKTATPSKKWLKYVQTSQAKEAIKEWFEDQERMPKIKKGKKMLREGLIQHKTVSLASVPKHLFSKTLQQLKLKSLDDLFFAIGNGDITVIEVLRLIKVDPIFAETFSKKACEVEVTDKKYSLYEPELANCCNPASGDPIKAELKGKTILVHHARCKEIQDLKESELVEVQWRGVIGTLTQFDVIVKGAARTGLLSEISKTFAEAGVAILSFEAHHIEQEILEGQFIVESKSAENIYEALRETRKLRNIIEARMVN